MIGFRTTFLRRTASALCPRRGVGAPLSGNTNLANYDRHLDSDFLADIVCHPEIVDRCISILGPSLLCWRSEFFSKYPGEEGTDWHQADTFAMASGKPQIIWPGEVRDAVTKSPFGGTITVWTAVTGWTAWARRMVSARLTGSWGPNHRMVCSIKTMAISKLIVEEKIRQIHSEFIHI